MMHTIFAQLMVWGVGVTTTGEAARENEAVEKLTPHLSFSAGPVNAVTIEKDGRRLCVYAPTGGDPKCESVLLTHHRRDVLRGAKRLARQGAKVTAPARERDLIEKPQEFWRRFSTARFHDYDQQSTKILAEPLPVERWVKAGDQFIWQGLKFHVLDGAGFTRGGVCYLAELDGKRIAFTGDLIYGDGKLLDLYSFQDAIPEANIRGYHGYAARLAALIGSLNKIAAAKPDMLVAARGPVIRHPQQAIDRLVRRVRAVYSHYLSTNALNWYFKEQRMKTCGKRVLGSEAEVKLMPYALYQKTPDWVWEQGTSRLLISDEGRGFLLDCGNSRVIGKLKELMQQGVVQKIDGIFVTHYHDDHTDSVQAAAEEFHCPVYAVEQYADILANPSAYHMPAMTSNAIKDLKVMKDGQQMKWQEFDLTFHFYPGQAIYHGALWVKKKGEKAIFFIGDSFSPSGMDDYCLLNRNLVHEDGGYLLCLKKLRRMKEDFWLVNEHIPHVFSFNAKEMDYLENRYRARIAMLRELFPWDDPNYGIDEQWAVFYPYGVRAQSGKSQPVELEVRVTNHSPRRRTFRITPHGGGGALKLSSKPVSITLGPREKGKAVVRVQTPPGAGQYLVTADIESEGMQFFDWIEALITVE